MISFFQDIDESTVARNQQSTPMTSNTRQRKSRLAMEVFKAGKNEGITEMEK